MKLALKFTLAFVLGTIIVWGVYSYLRIQREIALFENDMSRDHASVGNDLAAAVNRIWLATGETGALAFIDEANASRGQVTIRWTLLDAPAGSPYYPDVPAEIIKDSLRTSTLTSFIAKVEADNRLYTYIRVPVDSAGQGVIELWESMAEKDRYVRATILRTASSIIMVGVVTGLISMLLGMLIVGRRVRSLIEKARDVAHGNLSGRVNIGSNDELGELAVELNAMSDRLAEAYNRITEEESAHQVTIEQLRHADRLVSVGKLASAVAHELGTPLNVILARAKMIASGEIAGDGVKESSSIIVNQSYRMVEIVRQLLDFARRRPLHKSKIGAGHIIRQAMALLLPIAQRHNVTIHFQTSDETMLINVDPDQIQQVLFNLIVNGIEAMPRGGRVSLDLKWVEASPPSDPEARKRTYARLQFRDEGEGIARENIARLFDPFFSTKGREKGTGLGLSISADIIREHGGWIEVECHADAGTSFMIYLPKESTE